MWYYKLCHYYVVFMCYDFVLCWFSFSSYCYLYNIRCYNINLILYFPNNSCELATLERKFYASIWKLMLNSKKQSDFQYNLHQEASTFGKKPKAPLEYLKLYLDSFKRNLFIFLSIKNDFPYPCDITSYVTIMLCHYFYATRYKE